MKKKKKKKKRKKNKNKQGLPQVNQVKLNVVNPNDLYAYIHNSYLTIKYRFADSDQSEDEGIPDYKIGGYHPIHIGELLIDRYVVV